MRRFLTIAAALALLSACSGDEPDLEQLAEQREQQVSESPDAPAPPLTSEEAEADLTELLTEQEQLELTLSLALLEVWYGEDVTDEMRAEACAEGVDAIVDAVAEAAPEFDTDEARTYAADWFDKECALAN